MHPANVGPHLPSPITAMRLVLWWQVTYETFHPEVNEKVSQQEAASALMESEIVPCSRIATQFFVGKMLVLTYICDPYSVSNSGTSLVDSAYCSTLSCLHVMKLCTCIHVSCAVIICLAVIDLGVSFHPTNTSMSGIIMLYRCSM